MSLVNIEDGDVVLVFADEKWRIGVVVRTLEKRLVVVYARGTERDRPHVPVEHRTRDGIALGLTKVSFFYAPPAFASPTAVKPTGRRCPPALFSELQKIVGL
jgi:hypothetical protein